MKSLPKNYLWALIIFIAVSLWIISGLFISDDIKDTIDLLRF